MRFKVGKPYHIKFYDHCTNMDEPMVCKVMGWVVKQSSLSVVLATWLVETRDEQVREDNREIFTLLKSTIVKVSNIDYQ